MIVAVSKTQLRATTFTRRARILIVMQFVVGLCVVRVLFAQQGDERERERIAVQMQRVDNLTEKVRRLEETNIDRRLAVLEQVQSDSRETKLVSYGTALSLIGTLLVGLFERRTRKADTIDIEELAKHIREGLVK